MACQRCRAQNGREYTITKESGTYPRIFCDKCAEITGETYPVRAVGRQPVKPKDEKAPVVEPSSSIHKEKEE